MKSLVYSQCRIFKDGQFLVSNFSRPLMFGESVYTTFSVCNGKIFFLQDHLTRLVEGVSILLNPEFDSVNDPLVANIKTGISEVVKEIGDKSFSVRVNVFLISDRREYLSTNKAIDFSIHAYPLDNLNSDEIVNLKLIEYQSRLWPSSLKIGMSADRIFDLKKVVQQGYSGVLYCHRGIIFEASVSNIFFITTSGEIITPRLQDGILDGITRRHYLKYFKESGIIFFERDILVDEIELFAGCFLTNAVTDFNLIGKIDHYKYHYNGLDFQRIKDGFKKYKEASLTR